MTKARNIADLGSNDVIETTATGVDVTGTVTVDGLTVDGSSDQVTVNGTNNNGATLLFLKDSNVNGTGLIHYNSAHATLADQTWIKNYTASGSIFIAPNNQKSLELSSNGDVSFYEDTGTTAKMVWDASAESLGIGTASPSSALSVATNGGAWAASLSDGVGINYNSGNANISTYSDDTTLTIGAGVTQKNGMTIYGQTGGNRIQFDVAGSESARIDSSGNLLVGRTSQLGSNSKLTLECNATVDDGLTLNDSYTGAGSAVSINFYRNSTKVGSITNTTSSVAYNTTSDERLKENIVDTTHSVNIDDIKVREYDWKVDGEHQRFGFIAQELETVYPEAVTSPEDPEEMKSVDYSKLVPLLVKEIQTLKARIEELEK